MDVLRLQRRMELHSSGLGANTLFATAPSVVLGSSGTSATRENLVYRPWRHASLGSCCILGPDKGFFLQCSRQLSSVRDALRMKPAFFQRMKEATIGVPPTLNVVMAYSAMVMRFAIPSHLRRMNEVVDLG